MTKANAAFERLSARIRTGIEQAQHDPINDIKIIFETLQRQWFPIEDCPKDGTKFDVHHQDGRAVNCEWSDKFGVICKHGYPQVESVILSATHFMIIEAPEGVDV